ncbi:hypothetical protein AC628_00140 [Bradyrhizobium sp. NAS96.2]|nr:hypothetical protein AC628_00140 [Bradyrhizobium sp. NAS96.2]
MLGRSAFEKLTKTSTLRFWVVEIDLIWLKGLDGARHFARAFSVVSIQLTQAWLTLRRFDEVWETVDASIEALAGENADLDLNYVQPPGVLWDIVELQSGAQFPPGIVSRRRLMECKRATGIKVGWFQRVVTLRGVRSHRRGR